MNTVLTTFKNESDGLQSFVTEGVNGFHVSLKDIDADEFVGSVICYKSLDAAITKAKEIV